MKVNQGLSVNQATQELTDLIKASAGVATQYPATGTHQFTTGSNVLILKLPSVSASGQIIDEVFDYAIITKEPAGSKILKIKIFPDNLSTRKSADKVVSTSLKNVNFTYLNSSNVQVPSSQAARINFIINQEDTIGAATGGNSSSAVVNIKNL